MAKERQRNHGGTAPGRKTHDQNSGEVSPQVSGQLAARGEVSHDTVSRCNGVDVGLPNAVGSLQGPTAGGIRTYARHDRRLNANACVKKCAKERRSAPVGLPKQFYRLERLSSAGGRVMNEASSTQTSIWD